MKPATNHARSLGLVATSTFAAGVLGIVANGLIAARFGRSWVTDAFFMAQSLPLIFGKFFQTGPLPQLVMPIFVEARAKDPSALAARYASNVITTAGLVFGGIAVLIWVGAPTIVRLIAPGFQGEVQSLTIALSRMFVPVIWCAVLASLLTAFLHAHQRFAFPELMARLPGALMIVAALGLAARWGIAALVWALVVGSLMQVAALWVGMQRAGVVYRPLVDWRQPELRTTCRRLAPFFVSAAAVQLQLVVHRLVTSQQAVGTLSALSYADRITNFLITLLSAVPTVMFPRLIQDALASDRDELCRRLQRLVVLISLAAFPIAVSLIVLREPVIRLFLERGQFDVQATRETALALGWLATGLFVWSVSGLCKSAAYAVQRPHIVNVTVVAASLGTVGLTLTFGRWWGLAGLALSWGLTPYLMAGVYLWQLRRNIPHIHRLIWNPTLLRLAAATAGMGGVGWALRTTVFAPLVQGATVHGLVLGLCLTGGFSVASYAVFLQGLGIDLRSLVGHYLTGRVRLAPVPVVQRLGGEVSS